MKVSEHDTLVADCDAEPNKPIGELWDERHQVTKPRNHGKRGAKTKDVSRRAHVVGRARGLIENLGVPEPTVEDIIAKHTSLRQVISVWYDEHGFNALTLRGRFVGPTVLEALKAATRSK